MGLEDNLARDAGCTRKEVLDALNVLEEFNASTTVRSEHGVAGAWLNALNRAVLA
ncbi:hypothetical protein [Rhodococcus sp. ARC_M6]|uniref:hypothetical protein n=1 Tax=Rhodococcus sp. ARC_M6 TaxID=2928852 RepID=UPI001FB30D0F|nr:hypothetical protein [Rhodococcus sp. ARC_M6]MCJ0906246.1 hypothetical protein [Rhodococcus sp. ARC_M6]